MQNDPDCPWLASLPWYDLPEVRGATDRLWRRLARELACGGVPRELERAVPYEQQWRSGRLLFGQACGYDLLLPHAKNLQLLATPCYRAAGCDGPLYSSNVVVRDDSPARELPALAGCRAVFNNSTSHSGTNALRALVLPHQKGGRFFAETLISGSHEQSLDAVRRGRADVAAIDCVVFALLARHRPRALDGLRVLCQTPPVPAPPYVTSAATPPATVERLRAALGAALADPDLEPVKDELLLDGVEVLPFSAYRPIFELECQIREPPVAAWSLTSGGAARPAMAVS